MLIFSLKKKSMKSHSCRFTNFFTFWLKSRNGTFLALQIRKDLWLKFFFKFHTGIKNILTDDWLLVTLAFCPSLSSSIGAGSSTTSAGTTSFGGSGGDAGGSDPANRANLFRRIWKSKFQCNVLTEKKLCEVNSQKISRNKNQQEFNFARDQSNQPFQPGSENRNFFAAIFWQKIPFVFVSTKLFRL